MRRRLGGSVTSLLPSLRTRLINFWLLIDDLWPCHVRWKNFRQRWHLLLSHHFGISLVDDLWHCLVRGRNFRQRWSFLLSHHFSIGLVDSLGPCHVRRKSVGSRFRMILMRQHSIDLCRTLRYVVSLWGVHRVILENSLRHERMRRQSVGLRWSKTIVRWLCDCLRLLLGRVRSRC